MLHLPAAGPGAASWQAPKVQAFDALKHLLRNGAERAFPAQFPDVCFGGGPHADRGAPLAAEMEHVFPVLELQFAQVKPQTGPGPLIAHHGSLHW